MQRGAFARAVAAEHDHQRSGGHAQLEPRDEYAPRNLHRHVAAGERTDVVHRTHPISAAVSGPTSMSSRLPAIMDVLGPVAMRPAMISPNSCGYSGARPGSPRPTGASGWPVARSYLSVAPSVCSTSCAITTSLLPAA